jgi:hypothetical protein
MGATATQAFDKQLLWRAYRDAFRRFDREAARLAKINARASYDPAEAEAALLCLEQARLTCNDTRDTLAAFMMSQAARQAFWAIPAATRQETHRVKGLAELFWELAGKPQGSADDDWYRAERVVRRAGAEVCCAR